MGLATATVWAWEQKDGTVGYRLLRDASDVEGRREAAVKEEIGHAGARAQRLSPLKHGVALPPLYGKGVV